MNHWTENDIVVNGIKIHYLRTGRGDKPALVLSHGFSGSGWSWYEIARALEANFDLILPDTRGHGQSHRCAKGEQTDLTGDLAGLITALELEKPVVGGHSLGANYAARVAACYPGLVGALVLVDPAWYQLIPGVPDEPRPPDDDDSPPGESSYDRWLVHMQSVSMEAALAELREKAPHKEDAALLRWAETVRSFDANFFTTQDVTEIDFPQVVHMIRCPTLLVTGEARLGAIVGVHQAKWIAEQNPLFELARVMGAGHNILEDNFEDAIRALQKFLARLAQKS